MSSCHHYEAYGRRIRSDVELPLRVASPGDVDLILRTSRDTRSLLTGPLDAHGPRVVASYEMPGQSEPWYVATDEPDGYRLRIRGVGEFQIDRDLHELHWVALPDGRADLAPVLFSGTVLALLFILQGHLVLHASAVCVDGESIAFVGQSGRGKSTSAALCAAAGATIVSDDVLIVDVRDDGVWCLGSGGELRLRAKARELASLFSDEVPRYPTPDDRMAVAPVDGEAGWTRLRAIAIPSPSREHTSVEVDAVPPLDGLIRLLRFPRVEGLRRPELAREQLARHGDLVKHVPLYEVSIPWGPPWLMDVGHELLRALHSQVRLRD